MFLRTLYPDERECTPLFVRVDFIRIQKDRFVDFSRFGDMIGTEIASRDISPLRFLH